MPTVCITLTTGTFRSRETVGDLKSFVRQHINVEWAVFTLTVGGQGTLDDDNITLADANLVSSPSSLFITNFILDTVESIQLYITTSACIFKASL